jgi:hypothetical protein
MKSFKFTVLTTLLTFNFALPTFAQEAAPQEVVTAVSDSEIAANVRKLIADKEQEIAAQNAKIEATLAEVVSARAQLQKAQDRALPWAGIAVSSVLIFTVSGLLPKSLAKSAITIRFISGAGMAAGAVMVVIQRADMDKFVKALNTVEIDLNNQKAELEKKTMELNILKSAINLPAAQ